MTKTPRETVVAARERAAAKDWEAVRELLTPTVAQKRRGLPLFLLAKAEYELGNPAAAEPLVDEFREQRPGHVAAHLLTARVKLAQGDLEEAESAAQIGAALASNDRPYQRILDRIASVRGASASSVDAVVPEDVADDLAIIDAGHLAAREAGPSEEMIEAATRLAAREPGNGWARDLTQAKIAHFAHATDLRAALRNYDPHLIDVSARFGYITWPRRIQEHVRGKKVLDVGCGFGGFGMGFLVAGASSYVGLDPAMDLDSTRAKDKHTRQWDDMGITPRQIAAALPAIRLLQSTSEDQDLDETFDTIALHNVTEHLAHLDDVIAGLTRLCHSDTALVLHHHSFYSWNGHHQAPVRPDQLDESDPRHQQLYDWRHINLVPQLPEDHYIRTNLNRVRLDDLRASIERHFEIERWDELPSTPAAVQRLTPEIVERVREVVPDITERDLTINTVLCVARPKP
ncbi:methyltransferase [Nocardioides antri]|uniref:Tetratricopeptide repeat protein n=1 Tax=Nocardioides antri TaxID=2607659 RepID=A0A5B1M3V2_9ACTN|nr:methyltransferase [Nocardioides antri]KAA1427454.1 tetratricopeptide repeat protein [Nocardioides antri]